MHSDDYQESIEIGECKVNYKGETDDYNISLQYDCIFVRIIFA